MAPAARQENKSSKGWSTQHSYVVNRYSHVIIKSALLSVLVIMKECQTSMAYYLIIGLLLTFVLIRPFFVLIFASVLDPAVKLSFEKAS